MEEVVEDVIEVYDTSPELQNPLIDLTGDTEELYQPLSPSPKEIKLEEEEIIFDESTTGKDKGGEWFSRPFIKAEPGQ